MLTNTLKNRGMNMAKESTDTVVDCVTKGHKSIAGNRKPDWNSVCPGCAKLKVKLATLEKLCEDITKRNVVLKNNRHSPSQKRRGNRDGKQRS